MPTTEVFGKKIRELRHKKNLSTRQLADMLYVSQPTVTRWETGERMPDISMLQNLARCLGVEVSELLEEPEEKSARPEVILVDDEQIILSGELPVIRRALPGANVSGFIRPSQALDYARQSRVNIAFLDIELGKMSGLELCRMLLEVDPRTNIFFLTAYRDYSYDAWNTGACGFLTKPVSAEEIKDQMKFLRYPVKGLFAT